MSGFLAIWESNNCFNQKLISNGNFLQTDLLCFVKIKAEHIFLRQEQIVQDGFKNTVGNDSIAIVVFDKTKHFSRIDILVERVIRDRLSGKQKLVKYGSKLWIVGQLIHQ